MNLNGGAGAAVFAAFFSLFGFLITFCAYLLLYTFTAAVGIVYWMLMGMRWLYRRHQAKKTDAQVAATLADPPMPVMGRVK